MVLGNVISYFNRITQTEKEAYEKNVRLYQLLIDNDITYRDAITQLLQKLDKYEADYKEWLELRTVAREAWDVTKEKYLELDWPWNAIHKECQKAYAKCMKGRYEPTKPSPELPNEMPMSPYVYDHYEDFSSRDEFYKFMKYMNLSYDEITALCQLYSKESQSIYFRKRRLGLI